MIYITDFFTYEYLQDSLEAQVTLDDQEHQAKPVVLDLWDH